MTGPRVTADDLAGLRRAMTDWDDSRGPYFHDRPLSETVLALLDEIDRLRTDEGRGLWSCPDCAFTFDAMHHDSDGGYSCPACAEIKLERDLAAAQTQIAAVRALHSPREVWLSPFSDARGPQCSHCRGDDWPCATVAALAEGPE